MAEIKPELTPQDDKNTAPPPAGPHAKEHLIDREKTPGTGALPEKGETEADVGPD